MPMVGSILIEGMARMSGGTMPCRRCHAEVSRTWMIQCGLYVCGKEHWICADCIGAIQRFACADPAAASARLKAAAERAAPAHDAR